MSVTNIKFEAIKFDMKAIAMSRVLSQYYDSKILKLLIQAYIEEIQELSTAIYDLISKRTLNLAEGTTLDIIGKIVGRPREYYEYETDFWFTPDTDTSQPDNGHWWTYPAEQAIGQLMDDETYRQWLWLQILENHNLYSSVPELKNNVLEGIGEGIGIQRVGMVEADIYVNPNISLTNKKLLIYNKDTQLTDNDYLFPYPAAMSINQVEEIDNAE